MTQCHGGAKTGVCTDGFRNKGTDAQLVMLKVRFADCEMLPPPSRFPGLLQVQPKWQSTSLPIQPTTNLAIQIMMQINFPMQPLSQPQIQPSSK